MLEKVPEAALGVLQKLEENGDRACLVGGCVRDLLRGVAAQDWDMATSARPEQVLALFGKCAHPTGLRHGTVTVRAGEYAFEITTFRVDGAYADGRHPDHVTFTASLEEDLARRDFTVNAMAMDRHGAITDCFGGREDLQNRVLRCVGTPRTRFEEDALRILRALRFSATLGFSLEAETAHAVHFCAPLLQHVAAERLRDELLKLLTGSAVVPVLLEYPDVLGVFLPEILPSVGCDQKNYHHCYDVWEHIAHSVGAIAPADVLRMTMLLHDLGKPACMTVDEQGVGHFKGHADVSCTLAERILRRLRFDKARSERILALVKRHDMPVAPTERAMRRLLQKMTPEGARMLLQVKRADNLAQAPAFLGRQKEIDALEALLQQTLEAEECFSLKRLAVNGNDLLLLGYRGRQIGQALQKLLDAVIDGKLPNEKAALLAALAESSGKDTKDTL